ncbi:MAG: hypothetical protein M0Z72_04700 [Deltaproteobacteria bacterium]|nr:hypothetical protein [Deltaproteobacteria bacterium]
MSSQLIAFPAENLDYKNYFKFAYYNFLECLEEGEAFGIDFSEDKKKLKDMLDKFMNCDNINI